MNKKELLNICHINSCSLFSKMSYFRQFFYQTDISIICVSETWFNDSHLDSMVNIDGYNIIRHDRNSTTKVRGGGVCMYIRSDIKFRTMSTSKPNSKLEGIFAEIQLENESVLVGCVYNPPKCNDLKFLQDTLTDYSPTFENIIITGDFNINQLVITTAKSNLDQLLDGFGACVLNSNPTHLMSSQHHPTCLDLLITNNVSKVNYFDQMDMPGISSHDLVFLSFKVNLANRRIVEKYYRNFNNINMHDLENDLVAQNWQDILLLPDADSQLSRFNSIVTQLYEKHVPLKLFKDRPLTLRSTELNRALLDRDLAHRRWRRSGMNEDLIRYKELRERAKDIEKRELRAFHSKRFKHGLSSKELWKNINNLGLKNKTEHNPTHSSTELNNTFILNSSAIPAADSYVVSNALCGTQFSHINLTVDETICCIQSIKSNAIGKDNICPRFLKIILPYTVFYICHILNTILTTSTFPEVWKCSKVLPVPKSNKPTAATDYRPISIVPFLSKVLEKAISNQLNIYLNANKLLTPQQSGFRPGRSTTTALINITEDIRISLDANMNSALVFLDFSKAFDNVDHEILLKKLHYHFGVGSTTCKLLKTYLNGRSQQVYQKEDISPLRFLTRGVPQGSVLGPLLFSLYINDLPTVVKHSNCHLFADDVQLEISGKKQDGVATIGKLNEDLENILKWSCKNGLHLNPTKSSSMLIQRQKLLQTNWPEPTLNNIIINRLPLAKNLGLTFDEQLKWDSHINKLCGNVYHLLSRLWKIAWATPRETRLRLVKSLVLPTFMYGSPVFQPSTKSLMTKLQTTLNACTRFVVGKRKFDRLGNDRNLILGSTLSRYYDQITCVTLFKIVRFNEPDYLFSRIQHTVSQRTRMLTTQRRNCQKYNNMFFLNGIKLWNSLPNELRRITRLSEFKRRCKEHFSQID